MNSIPEFIIWKQTANIPKSDSRLELLASYSRNLTHQGRRVKAIVVFRPCTDVRVGP